MLQLQVQLDHPVLQRIAEDYYEITCIQMCEISMFISTFYDIDDNVEDFYTNDEFFYYVKPYDDNGIPSWCGLTKNLDEIDLNETELGPYAYIVDAYKQFKQTKN